MAIDISSFVNSVHLLTKFIVDLLAILLSVYFCGTLVYILVEIHKLFGSEPFYFARPGSISSRQGYTICSGTLDAYGMSILLVKKFSNGKWILSRPRQVVKGICPSSTGLPSISASPLHCCET